MIREGEMSKKRQRRKKHTNFILKIIFLVLLSGIVVAGISFFKAYNKIFAPNIELENLNSDFIFIPTGSGYRDVAILLFDRGIIADRAAFEWLAEKKNYKNHVHPGRYRLEQGMSNNELINMLRSGEQVPVNVTFNNIRDREELAGLVAGQLELDSLDLLHKMNDQRIITSYGFEEETFTCMFIPNTYEFYWNTSPSEFLERMAKEYKKFWNEERKQKAHDLGLSQSEVTILASIVQEEQKQHVDERPVIAGVYINRLNKGMRLEADPTVKYAVGEMGLKRVLTRHTKINSPYNTYRNKGLPPGPICLPDISSIDAVLNYQKHDYIFMCAKDDFSGYHNFAETHAQHVRNSKAYQRALNQRGIY